MFTYWDTNEFSVILRINFHLLSPLSSSSFLLTLKISTFSFIFLSLHSQLLLFFSQSSPYFSVYFYCLFLSINSLTAYNTPAHLFYKCG